MISQNPNWVWLSVRVTRAMKSIPVRRLTTFARKAESPVRPGEILSPFREVSGLVSFVGVGESIPSDKATVAAPA
jgi:hypothetical protein